MEDISNLRWRFDIGAFRLLGKELITDKITAIFELVKNSYDANAQNVYIEFRNVGTISAQSQITIRDDGLGMTLEDIKNKWMVVGTSHKRLKSHSPAPYSRKYVGQKGVGRFAADKLGEKLFLITKTIDAENRLNLSIDWEKYEALRQQTNTTLFTDVDNVYYEEKYEKSYQGTELRMSKIHDIWTAKDIERLKRELSKLVSPFYPQKYPFNIHISSNEHQEKYYGQKIHAEAILFASQEVILDFDKEQNWQEVLMFDTEKHQLTKRKKEIPYFGTVKFHLYYFNSEAKDAYKRHYVGKEAQIDGIKLYRDGLLATPFVQKEQGFTKRKDVLGLDTYFKYANFLDVSPINSSDYIGIIEITQENNPQIIDVTDRQDFVDNEAYRNFKDFIFRQLIEIGKIKHYEKEQAEIANPNPIKQVAQDMKAFSTEIHSFLKVNPQFKAQFQHVLTLSDKNTKALLAVEKKNQIEKSEKERINNLYLSLLSLQLYAAELAHGVKTPLKYIIQDAEFFKQEFPNPKYNEFYKTASSRIYDKMNQLREVVDYMLSYATAGKKGFEEFSLKSCIEHVFLSSEHIFSKENIHTSIEIKDNCLLFSNPKFIEDIINNLLDNAIKAVKDKIEKIIKCWGEIENNTFVLYFSDNGIGILPEDKDNIFEIYYTSTLSEGGTGLGLYIVQSRLKALKGTIELIEPEFEVGATFKITLPFKKHE